MFPSAERVRNVEAGVRTLVTPVQVSPQTVVVIYEMGNVERSLVISGEPENDVISFIGFDDEAGALISASSQLEISTIGAIERILY